MQKSKGGLFMTPIGRGSVGSSLDISMVDLEAEIENTTDSIVGLLSYSEPKQIVNPHAGNI